METSPRKDRGAFDVLRQSSSALNLLQACAAAGLTLDGLTLD